MAKTRGAPVPTRRIRKTMDVDGAKLAAARKVLRARTGTDAVHQALDYVVFQAKVFVALDALAAAGGLEPFPKPSQRLTSARRERRRG